MNLFRHELHPPSIRRNGDIGYLGVKNGPALHQLMELSLRVGAVQQGPVPPMPGTLELLIDRGRKVHNHTALREHPAVVLFDHGAAPGRQHDRVQARQAFDGLLFADPEAGLALLLENERDIHAGPGLDVGVAVVKGKAQHAREMAPHGGLTRAHGADEKDVSLG